jgi:P-type conjugative transfer protein TrbG
MRRSSWAMPAALLALMLAVALLSPNLSAQAWAEDRPQPAALALRNPTSQPAKPGPPDPAFSGPAAAATGSVRVSRGAPRPSRKAARGRSRPVAAPLDQLDRANSQARDGPSRGVFVNSTLYHPFEPGRLYAIHTSPRFLTTIALRPGEKLISKAAGDTVRWVLGETEAGAGEAMQVIVFVKPMRADLRTNIVLTTDQRTYLIDAISTPSGAYTSVLAWTYPQEEAKARAAAALASAQQAQSAAPAVPVERLDFGYAVRVLKGRAPPWRPVRVFNDGAKTYIEFPPDLAVREAPPLFLLDEEDQAQLVNYRHWGRYVVVDRLVERAELRLGDKKPVVVRITRQGGRS